MGRFALSLLAVAVLAGCPYQPLAYDENVPSMEDAVKHPTIVVHGRSTVVWQAQNGEGALTGEFCRTTADVSGWLSPDLNDESCVGCQDVYTLELDENSSNCDFGMAQFAVIAFTPAIEAPMMEAIEAISSSICTKVPSTSGSLRERYSAISEEGVIG